ncbi:MAG: AI-2E family transporter [Tannerellaceae bacterium]|nr:AI-2E family transporter [Tannerellaceae bacterium]
MSVREQYWKYSLIGIVLVLGYILFREFIPYLGGILGAITIYILVRNQMFYLIEKKHWGRGISALLILLESILVFLIPLSGAVWLFVSKVQDLNLDPNALIHGVEHIADVIEKKTGFYLLEQKNLDATLALIPKAGQYLMEGISGFGINVAILVLVLYFMLIGGREMEAYVYSILPFSDENKKQVMEEIKVMVKSNAIGIPLLAIIQGVIATIGYFIFKVPTPILFGLITCVTTIVPVIGTALVWAPLCIYMGISGHWLNAIGLGVYALIVISNADNFIRFMLQKKLADIHPLITIFGVFIGLSLFGFIGVIFGPLLLSFFLLCFNFFKREFIEGKEFNGINLEGMNRDKPEDPLTP